MRLTLSLLAITILLLLPGLGDAQRPHQQETPYAATLSGGRMGRQFLFLTREDVPQGRTNSLPRNLRTEEETHAYFEANHKAVIWADMNLNVIVLDTEEPRGYSRVLLIEGPVAGKIGWIAKHFVHRSARTLTGQPNTEKVNAVQKKVAYDAKDRRIYSVTYAQAHSMHDAGGDLLVVVPMTLLPAEARLSRAMNGKLD
jgi:hypothetical protein